jgi:tetratricopeptide (TPR) repeat protein
LYPFPSAGWPFWQVILAASGLILITVAVVILRRSRPYLLTGWLWYLVMLGPVIGVFQVGAQARADRYTYLPQIGLYLLAVWAVADWCGTRSARRIALTAGSAIILAGLIFSTRAQTSYWRDSESLWTHALGVTSGNFIAHNNLGTALFQRGDLNGATNQYQAALQIRPDYEEAHFNLGTALLQSGDAEGAINEFQTALRLQPDHAQAHINLGSALAQKGDVRDAIAQIQSGLRLDPGNVEANNNLAWLLATSSEPSLRDGRRAVELAQQANRLAGGGNMSTLRTLAAAEAEAGRFDDAVQNAQAALALAQAAGRSDLITVLKNEITLYQARQPLREAGQ